MATPSSKELELLPKFRESVSDLGLTEHQNSDSQLLRWLRARDMNLKKSEDMLRNAMKWRFENDVDNILQWKAPAWYLTHFPYEFSGFSEKNSPIMMVPFGYYDVKKVADIGEKDVFFKYSIQQFERLAHEMKDKINPLTNYPVSQIVIIADISNYPYSQLTSMGAINILMENLKIMDNYYPETLEKIFVINAPGIFSILFNMVKPIMAKKTVEKFDIFSDESKWKPALLKNIQADQLPSKYGGCGERSIMNHRGERNVLYSNNESFANTDIGDTDMLELGNEINSVAIKSGSKKKLVFETIHPNTSIHWIVKVEKYDIGLSIMDENNREIFTYKKSIGVSNGGILCSKPGPYFICLDNSYSKIRSKSVKIQVEITSPKNI